MKWNRTPPEDLVAAFQSAMEAYRSQRQEAIVNVISDVFSGADILSLSLQEKINLSKARDKKAKELMEKMFIVVTRYCLPRRAQTTREEGSSAASVE
ncbi:hypothetical protein FRB93_011793 [Tulasnella sp. JGI-2019a]|nr:hypothetical protein FRB93_011793 [Tulasnella sp. JGI-2019a]